MSDGWLRRMVNAALGRLDLQVVRRSTLARHAQSLAAGRRVLARLNLDERQVLAPSAGALALPPGAVEYLREDHPRLLELRRRYAALRHPITTGSQWSDEYVRREVDLRAFRGDFGYVYQFRDVNTELHYVLVYYHVLTRDPLDLLAVLREDGMFGAHTFPIDAQRLLSRDLLDSILELDFLERTLAISRRPATRILDIGAGYGRFAHRAVEALPNLEVHCTDAIATSTFLCEYYLGFREVGPRAVVVPADRVERALADTPFDLAVAIHSLSECPLLAIEGWLDLLQAHRVPYLMVVPNALDDGGVRLVSREKDGSRVDFEPALRERGYELVVRHPKYLDPIVQRHGVTPTQHYLFRLRE